MIGGRVARHTLQRERPARVPAGRGGVKSDFTGVIPVDLPGWAVDAGETAADTQHRDGAHLEWTVRGPFTADVDRHDRITLFGDHYQIRGAVIRQPGPTARTSHTLLHLERWEG